LTTTSSPTPLAVLMPLMLGAVVSPSEPLPIQSLAVKESSSEETTVFKLSSQVIL